MRLERQRRPFWGRRFSLPKRLIDLNPLALAPVTPRPLVIGIRVMEMILRIGFVCVPPIVIMVLEAHAGPIQRFGTGAPAVTVAIASDIG